MKKFLSSPAVTAAFFVLGVALILFGAVNAILAAPKIQSSDYKAQMTLSHVKTQLLENEAEVEGEDALLHNFLAGDQQIKLGRAYKEEIKAKNPGDVDEYVRIKIRKYWTDDKGKRVDLDPGLIELGISEEGWNLDEQASTSEEIVLYYNDILKAGETTSSACVKTVTISPKADIKVSSAQDEKDAYLYQNMKFNLDATVEAVQTHNGEDAMISAWGRTNKG